MRCLGLLLALALCSRPAAAQEGPDRLTAEDYARAERFLAPSVNPLVVGGTVRPRWLEDGRLWYARELTVGDEVGTEYFLADPRSSAPRPLFDHDELAAALTEVADRAVSPYGMRLLAISESLERGLFQVEDTRYLCDVTTPLCQRSADEPERGGAPPASVVSPDGRLAAFVRGYDLWVRDLVSERDYQLTTDGIEDFGYATNNAGWVRGDRPVLAWSPDSRKIATFQHDARGVGMMYAVSTEVGHPELDAWRYPLPEDSVIFRIQRVVIHVDRPAGQRVVRFDMPPDQHRSTCSDHVSCGGTFGDVQWSSDSERIVFVSSSRDHKRAQVRVADAATGVVTDLFEEVQETFFDSHSNWRYLAESDEVLWYSQRDDWGHLYLYDARTGEVEGQVTRGAWNVLDVVRVDAERRDVWFMGGGREPGDPYFRYLYRADLDSGDLELLTPDSANHSVDISPDGLRIVDTYSTPVTPPVSVLRRSDGSVAMELDRADVSRLEAIDWKPPMPFVVKARDGSTDLHGLLFSPTELDPSARYPVINYLYPGPQSGSVGSRSFRAAHRDLQALAELGFVVVELDAMGTPGRSKTFQDAYYGNMGDNGLPDQIAGIRELADRYDWIDDERVGIYGHSGGGFAAAAGVLRHPDFYDVAVAQAGNHDNRNYEDDWGEKWQGLLRESSDGTTNYDNQANQLVAGNLVGKLLIAHGTLDTNVPVSNTMLVVDALIEANKDFDLVLFPNRGHGFGNEPYMMRKRWDYFVMHLLGAEAPPEYEFGQLD